MNTILKMCNISKSFGGVRALVDVHLTVGTGEIHALMGENGAGKSTLMNVLTGVVPLDEGTIEFDGKFYPRPTIRQMEEAGIAFVHQELSVINDLTVYENIFLNREIRNKWHVLEKKQMIEKTRDLFARLGQLAAAVRAPFPHWRFRFAFFAIIHKRHTFRSFLKEWIP